MAVEKKMYDPDEIRKAINILKPDNELFEVRCLEPNGKQVYSGYFRDAEVMLNQLGRINSSSSSIYITLNRIKDICYSREQRDVFVKNSKIQTSDNDIECYEWLFVDVDPRRPAGVSSSDKQLQKAKERGNKVFTFMRNLGFNDPVSALSGNGIHLLYRFRLVNSEENKGLLKNCLKALDMIFSDDEISIDTTNFNPARICKLYGTMARKGSNTLENPHRLSHLIAEGSLEPTDKSYLEKLAGMLPKEEKPQKYNSYRPNDFNLEEWLSKYGLRYRTVSYSDGVKYILEQCPFDSNHKGKDACIFQSRSGAIGFHCFHNSCSDKTWQDVRVLFEPDAYERRQQEYERRIYSRQQIHAPAKVIQPIDGKPVFYTAKDILNLPVLDERFIKTGITDLDKKLRGLELGTISLVSGLSGSGKSSIISQLSLEAIDNGENVGLFSWELKPKKLMKWMNLQAAGKGYTEATESENFYTVRRKYQQQIADWMGEHFFVYNNDYGNDFQSIYKSFDEWAQKKKITLLIFDNLMSFDIDNLSENENRAQTLFVLKLSELAKRQNIHVIFVAHPRKETGFLRLADVSGSNNLRNATDNAFILHRVDNDFRRYTKQMFGWKDDNEIYEATNVLEIMKDREGGVRDYFVKLYFEKETKRLKNYLAENRIYSWNKDNDGFLTVDDSEIPFK